MFLSLSHIFLLLERYKYFLIFPIAVIEGPMITVIAGFLVSLGLLNGPATYGLITIADLTGDILHYWAGRWWGHSLLVKKWGRFVGYQKEHEAALENHFKKHKGKTFLLGKLSHGVGGAVLMAAGIARVNFWEFLWFNTLATLSKTLLLILIGFYLGGSYMQIDKYLGYISFGMIGVAVLLVAAYVTIGRTAEKTLAE